LKAALIAVALAAILSLAGCAAELAFREGRQLVEAGQIDAGLRKIEEATRHDPARQDYRVYYMRHREIAVQRLLS
jgi:general secretion pathway protein D